MLWIILAFASGVAVGIFRRRDFAANTVCRIVEPHIAGAYRDGWQAGYEAADEKADEEWSAPERGGREEVNQATR
jgi:hypothetical protein